MDSPDCQVLSDALSWHGLGHRVFLVTVVQTWGSAPRPPGAVLAVRDDGLISGSVSGGCVEADLIDRARSALEKAEEHPSTAPIPEVIEYGVTQQDAARFGLPCGGTLRLVREVLSDTSWIAELLQRTAQHRLVARQLDLRTGLVSLADAQRGQTLQFDGSTLVSIFGPRWRLLLIGAGQLSLAVAHVASILDFEVLICDPRDEYAGGLAESRLQTTRIDAMPDDAVLQLVPDAHTAIVALTHDPKLDDLALLEALRSDAFYVGALGSRLNQQRRKDRLAQHFGLSESELARLHGPVGLDLGGKTPAEIAIAIVAEMVQVKNRSALSAQRKLGSGVTL